MKIALVQMQVREHALQENREHGLALMEEAAQNSDLVVLPEVWSTGYSLGHLGAEANHWGDALYQEIAAVAAKYKCHIVAGSLPVRRKEKFYNELWAFNAEGKEAARYAKIHLFRMFHEERLFAAGSWHGTFPLGEITCGASICYDLRFPELYRQLALAGAELIFVPAEWPVTRGETWRLLLQARAAENRLYICGVNCVGTFKAETFYGHSMLVAPTGEIIAEGSEGEEIIYSEIAVGAVSRAREKLNVLLDVRDDLFPRVKA